MTAVKDRLLEKSPYESDRNEMIGRDPRKLALEEALTAGLEVRLAAQAIRAKCKDCCGGSDVEVRKCVATDCALWLLRTTGRLPAEFKRHALNDRPSKPWRGISAANEDDDFEAAFA